MMSNFENFYAEKIGQNEEKYNKYKKYIEEHGQEKFAALYTEAYNESNYPMVDFLEFTVVIEDEEIKEKLNEKYIQALNNLTKNFMLENLTQLKPEEIAKTIIAMDNDVPESVSKKIEERMDEDM